jgi:hypothetical protein
MACKAEVFAPESTLALIVGIPNSGKEHHSSLPKINLLSNMILIDVDIKKVTNSELKIVIIHEFVV